MTLRRQENRFAQGNKDGRGTFGSLRTEKKPVDVLAAKKGDDAKHEGKCEKN